LIWGDLKHQQRVDCRRSGGNNILVGRATGDDDSVTISPGGKISQVILWVGNTSMLLPCKDVLADESLIPNSSFQENIHEIYLLTDCSSSAECNNDFSQI
jgi:hypothetical protein